MKKFQHYAITYIVLLFYFSFLLLPMIWIIYSSFRTQDAIFSGRILSAFNEFTLENKDMNFFCNKCESTDIEILSGRELQITSIEID